MSTVKLERGPGCSPVYLQISEALRRDIKKMYECGDALPSENELSSAYHVNRHTLRRAIDVLVQDGLVVRHQGKGMYVQLPKIEYPISSRTRLTEALEAQGRTANSRVFQNELIAATSEIASHLDLEIGAPVIFLEALRLSDDIPFCIGTHFIPYGMFPALINDYHDGSLHGFLEHRYGVELERRESMISTTIPEVRDISLLNIPPQTPALQVRSINIVKDTGIPAEYVVTRFRGDLAEIVVQPK